ncbi:hypothetical protein MRB53_034281 [Persea americana]|uniref:Uncharacterized protein n=1 Tax=Persea americana TaxID=3435 RepID=A0ACC2KWV1_PERAE|nr:hypothetical protein MRB53_034281 [Persea americana]
MTEVLSRVQTSSSPIIDSPMVPISIKLDGSNYGLWSQVVEMYISGKDKLGYINGDYHHPPETDPSFRKWRTENAMVKGWLINSMDHSLVVNFIRYPTAKQVWDSAATTYFDGTDTSQAYAHVRREDLRQSVMISEVEAVTSGAVMAIKGVKSSQSQKSGSSSRSKGHADGNKCTHCGSTRHTRDTYFKLHGYPDWWHELQARKKRDAPATEDVLGRAAMATAESQLSLIPVAEPFTSTPDQGCSQQGDNWVWY